METIRRTIRLLNWGKVADIGAFICLLYIGAVAVAMSAACYSSLSINGVTLLGITYLLLVVSLLSIIMTLATESGGKGFCWFIGGFSIESLVILVYIYNTSGISALQ
ncbi:MAG: hypothetical protein UT91_C0021G0010 [Parcubacteria group bacterium GW2011_GWA2_40_23]|nr:MAG: hypothetical protein UT91_C0021G0010 [Parcubacteria group bacterium GW2011_GWA2_40_23]